MTGEAGHGVKGSWGQGEAGAGSFITGSCNSGFSKDFLKWNFTSLHRQANVNLLFVFLNTTGHILYIMFSVLLLLLTT